MKSILLKYRTNLFISILIFQCNIIFASFKYTNYKDGEVEHFKSNIGNLTIKYIINDSTIEQRIKILNLTISNLYTYDDSIIYHKSKYISFLSYKEHLVDKSRSIEFKFPLKDSMFWAGKGIAERKGKDIPYVYSTFVKDTTILSEGNHVRCFKISSETNLKDGEQSKSLYYFSPREKKFIRVEMDFEAKGLIGKVLHFFRYNKIILYK